MVHDSFSCVLGGISSMPKKQLGPWGTKRENGNDIATMGATMKQQWGGNGSNNDKTTRNQKGLGFFHHFIVVLFTF